MKAEPDGYGICSFCQLTVERHGMLWLHRFPTHHGLTATTLKCPRVEDLRQGVGIRFLAVFKGGRGGGGGHNGGGGAQV